MNPVLIAILMLGAVGAVAALILVLAAKYMAVKEDERFPKIRECLPGANCGACGYAGCDGYAQALVDGLEDRINLCVPGADGAAHALAEALDKPFEDVVEQVAVVHCCGDNFTETDKCAYEGIQTCAAAKMLFGGKGMCVYKCAGLGDCVKACPNDAIHIVDGIAKVDSSKCTGCGICTRTCPNHLIDLFPDVSRVVVTCSNHDKGAFARKACKNACIGCKKCERNCPAGAIKVENNLAVIDYSKCTNCHLCAMNCPVGCIKISDFSGIHRYVKEEA